MTEDVPGYRVLEQVGEGGFSVVYRAHQERLDRMVALKVLSIGSVDDAALRRFQRESKITGRLSGHPNIVTVLDTGATRSGRPYIAMEYFEHGSLTDRLEREGPLPVAEVLRIGVKMAGALAATHETDVLHRDVKPQNILVSRYGEPALADFGIARLVDSFDQGHTQAFTPHHAAPEVLEGRTPGVASDVYSLGSTLYQLLAGQPAFRGPQGEGIAQLMLRILNDPPPPFRRADVPRPVYEAIAQAMAKSAEQRFPSAVAFAQRLQQIQRELGLPVTDLAHSGGVETGFPAPPPAAEPPTGGSSTYPQPPPVPDWAPTVAGPAAPQAVAAPAEPPSPWHPAAAQRQEAQAGARTLPPAPHPPAPHSPAPQPFTPQPVMPGGNTSPSWPPEAPRPAERAGPRRGLIVAAAVALVGGAAVGIGALALTGDEEPKRNGRTAAQNGGRPTTASGAPARPIGKQRYLETRPVGLAVKAAGRNAVLSWRLRPEARELPIIVQQAPYGKVAFVNAGVGGESATVSGLDPRKGYCFRVGAVLRINPGKEPNVSWSAPRCVRGAKPRA